MNLVLVEASEVARAVPGAMSAVLTGDRAQHVRQVLRAVPGDTIRIGIVDGPRGTAEVRSLDESSVTLRCDFSSETPARPRVDLLLAVPRPKVLNRLWAQLAAMGVGRIILTNAEKVERPYFDTHVLDPAHYRPLLIEGLQQARDTRLPIVSIHRRFRVLVEDELDALSDARVRLAADPSGACAIRDAAQGTPAAARVLLAIGPEGGWNAFELSLLNAHGFTTVGLGERTLRSDTACLALLALIHDALRPLSTG